MENSKELKILMLEDSESDATLIKRILKKDNLSFCAERVDTREEFTEAISRFRPDVILSDHGLPQFNSREALKIALQVNPLAPFIIVTGTMSDESAISCLRDGASDYILKGNMNRLPSAIRRAIKERRLERLKREARHALRKQNDELRKVNTELDSFVYSVSHNLRGPLASVLGLLNLALAEDKGSKMEPIHHMMKGNIERLDTTLKEILDYSRNSRNEISSEEVQWEKLIHGTFKLVSYADRFADVQQVVDVHAPVKFYTDISRFGIVLHNVILNAVLFADHQKRPSIKVNVSVIPGEARIIIQDNGIGIAPDLLPRAFDMFYRCTEQSNGAGLGLYIARETVKRLGGAIQIDSTEGTGTIVTITLPNRVGEE
jgi:signal transduction histidine kinase